MSQLILCTACHRHFRSTDERCPFCDASVAVSTRTPLPPIARGMSRAKRYALGAAVATGVATTACSGGDTTTTGGSTDSATDASGDGQTDTKVAEGGADTNTTGDSPADATAETATDAGDDADTRPCCPPYGCVFPDDERTVIV